MSPSFKALKSIYIVFLIGTNFILAQNRTDINLISIRSESLQATICTQGAELISLKNLKTETEYIWQPKEPLWKQSALVLFPIVGGLIDNKYTYDDVEYSLNKHGFAQGQNFKVNKQSEQELVLSLESSPGTVELYPFLFELRVSFKLSKSHLSVQYEVISTDDKTIYFSLGAPPGFNLPLDDETLEQYSLEFDVRETAAISLKTGNFINGIKQDFLVDTRRLNLSNTLFDNGALIFTELKSRSVTLKKKDKKILNFSFKGFSIFTLWCLNQKYHLFA